MNLTGVESSIGLVLNDFGLGLVRGCSSALEDSLEFILRNDRLV